MCNVELLYDPQCPNVAATRQNLSQALSEIGLPTRWQEWDTAAQCPEDAKRWGSPTVLVNGRDVAGQDEDEASACCRLYSTQPGTQRGVPPVQTITAALRAAVGHKGTDNA